MRAGPVPSRWGCPSGAQILAVRQWQNWLDRHNAYQTLCVRCALERGLDPPPPQEAGESLQVDFVDSLACASRSDLVLSSSSFLGGGGGRGGV